MTIFAKLRRSKDYSGHKWTTRDGVTIAIEDMTDSHIDNAIRHMELRADRSAERANNWYSDFDGPFDWPQGEMAQLAMQNSYSDPYDFGCEPLFDREDFLPHMKMHDVLVAERERREKVRHGSR